MREADIHSVYDVADSELMSSDGAEQVPFVIPLTREAFCSCSVSVVPAIHARKSALLHKLFLSER